MTVSTSYVPDVSTGDGVTAVFTYANKITANTELVVTKITISTSAEEVLVLTTDYTVSGVGDAGGGSITLVAGALAATFKLVIARLTPLTQAVDYQTGEKFPAETHEGALDKLTRIIQEQQESIDRNVQSDITQTEGLTLPAPVTDKVLGWKADGTITNLTPTAVTGPNIGSGDVQKVLRVNAGETDFELAQQFDRGSDIASASSITLGPEFYFDITGTATIQTITPDNANQRLAVVHFDSALTLTDSAGNLDLGGSNVSVAAGDNMLIAYDGTNWRIISQWPSTLQADDIGARVTGGAQSIANSTAVALAFTSERYDTDTIHDNSTNNTRLTAKTAGKYLIFGAIRWASNATGDRTIQIQQGASTANLLASSKISAAADIDLQTIATVMVLTLNQFVQLFVTQNSGGSLNIDDSEQHSPEFGMQLLART